MLVGAFSSGKVPLYHLKGLSVNDCFVGIFEDEDVFGIVLQSFLQFVGLGVGFEVYGVSHIFLIGQYPADGVLCPMIRSVQIGITASTACFLKVIHAWTNDFLSGEHVTNFHDTNATCVHFKDTFDDWCGFGIGDILLGIVGIFHISVWNGSPNPFSLFTFGTLYGSYLAACITSIKIVEIILDAGEVADTVCAVHTIVDGDKADIVLWEGDLHQHTRLQIISAESGLVFHDDDSHLAVFNIAHHLFEIGTVEIGTGVSVIHIEVPSDN